MSTQNPNPNPKPNRTGAVVAGSDNAALDHQAGRGEGGPDHGAATLVTMDSPDDSQLGATVRKPNREGGQA